MQSHSSRVVIAIMLVALWFFLAGCPADDDDDGLIDPDPFDASHLMGFWQCDELNSDSYPFTSLSFGDMSSGMLGDQESLEYFSWTATDTTLLLNLIDGIRTYNYDVADDTLSVWVGQGGKLYFDQIVSADTVYIEQNPYRVQLAVPEQQHVKLSLYDTAGIEGANLYESDLMAGMYILYFDYPQDEAGSLLAFDAVGGSTYHQRQYRYVTNRPDVPEQAKTLAAEFYDRGDYLSVEYGFAINPEYGDEFVGNEDEWHVLPIEDKVLYLPNNFRRILPENYSKSFYWVIGDYTYQFGYAWTDEADDDTLTVEWDGTSAKLTEFRQLLGLE